MKKRNMTTTHMKGFPSRHMLRTMIQDGDKKAWSESVRKVREILSHGGIAAIYGPRGNGKTQCACSVGDCLGFANSIHIGDKYTKPRMMPSIYMTAMGIFIEIKNTYRKGSQLSELDLMTSYSSAALLVIDEIQERGESEFENQKLTAIIDSRYRESLPTLIIGNYATSKEMASSLSPSIVSRIQEGGGAIHFSWPSFRPTK